MWRSDGMEFLGLASNDRDAPEHTVVVLDWTFYPFLGLNLKQLLKSNIRRVVPEMS